MDQYQSWGRYPRAGHQQAVKLDWRPNALPLPAEAGATVLPYGLGRSQGDSCLNEDGVLLDVSGLDRFINFDAGTGRLRCEAGVSLAAIAAEFAPRGWFLSVTPGTKYVTVGGAIANDVHGKNHMRAGTLGCHVTQFELLRSDGQRYLCSPESHADLFAATIGGLGLTGLITWAELQLKRIPSQYLQTATLPFRGVAEWLELSQRYGKQYEYLIGQVNAVVSSRNFGNGWLMMANHAATAPVGAPPVRTFTVPFDAPNALLNDRTMGAYNWWYDWRQRRAPRQRLVHYDPYFYPLDSIQAWNRLYGPRGFVQYQAVFPAAAAVTALTQILELMKHLQLSSYLGSLKLFGDRPSPGLLSFPRAGAAIALDFPMLGERTLNILTAFDEVTAVAGGRVYPAKDARLPARHFQQGYSRWQEFSRLVDPRFSSSFWRRVSQGRVPV